MKTLVCFSQKKLLFMPPVCIVGKIHWNFSVIHGSIKEKQYQLTTPLLAQFTFYSLGSDWS